MNAANGFAFSFDPQGTISLADGFASEIEPGVSATVVQTVGTKGYDGFTLALVTD